MRHFTPEEDAFIAAHYPTHGADHCATHLNRSRSTIDYRRKRLGLPTLSLATISHIRKHCRVYLSMDYPHPVHAHQFMNVTTPEVAYILGLVWADGYTHPNGRVAVACVKEDALQYLPTFMKTGQWKVTEYQAPNRRRQMTIKTGNKLLQQYLATIGYRSKSHVSACAVLSTIPDHLKHYWFRGLMDGDGCILNSNGQRRVGVASSYEQDWTYMETICRTLGCTYLIQRGTQLRDGHLDRSSSFLISNIASMAKLCTYIFQGYPTDRIGLSRKWDKWCGIARECTTNLRLRRKLEKAGIDPDKLLNL